MCLEVGVPLTSFPPCPALPPTPTPTPTPALRCSRSPSRSEMSELQLELSLMSALDEDEAEALLAAFGAAVARRWARGEEGGGWRRMTETTDWVCSQMRRKRRMLPGNEGFFFQRCAEVRTCEHPISVTCVFVAKHKNTIFAQMRLR